MHVLNEDRISQIDELAIRSELKQLFAGTLQIGPFQEYLEQPSNFYSQGWPDKPGNWTTFSERKLLPLWQHSEKLYALDLNSNPHECISWYAECPNEYETIRSIDNAIFEMIVLHVWEYGGDRQEANEAIVFAELVGLPNIDGLRTLLSNYAECTEVMIQGYRSSL